MRCTTPTEETGELRDAHAPRSRKESVVVETGTQIGKSGNTGNSTGPHLHLGVFMNSEDPNGAIWNADSGVGFIDPAA